MKRKNPRAQRIADQIQREIVGLIRHELKDPRVGMITITAVEVTNDHAHAKIFFTQLSGKEEVLTTLAALQRAAGFLRSGLAHRLALYSVPQLHFEYDDSIESGMRLSALISEAVAADQKKHGE